MSTIQNIAEGYALPKVSLKGIGDINIKSIGDINVKPKIGDIGIKDINLKSVGDISLKDSGKIKPDGSVVKPDGTTLRQPDAPRDFKDPDASTKKSNSEYGKYAAAAVGLAGALAAAVGYQMSKDGHVGKIKELKDKDGYVYVKFMDNFEMCPSATVSLRNTTVPGLDDEFGLFKVISKNEIMLEASSDGLTFPSPIPANAEYQYHIGIEEALSCAPGTVANSLDSLIMTVCDKLGLDFDKIKEYARYALYVIIAIVAYKIYKMVA
jgi:hypothetical protein